MNLEALFTYTDDDHSLPLEVEVGTIRAAQAGDDDAKERLLLAYGPALRSAVARFTRDGALDVEEARATALLRFVEVLDEHDPDKSGRLAGRLAQRVTAALADAATSSAAFAIPERTLSRFYGILREADGDPEEGLRIAPEFHMSRETFLAVLDAVRSVDTLDDIQEAGTSAGGSLKSRAKHERIESAAPLWGGRQEIADVEDQVLVEAAFQAVDDEEARVCELAYGFTEYDPVPDAEIGHRMGLTRPTVQRRRTSAIDKMRKTLGVLPEGERR